MTKLEQLKLARDRLVTSITMTRDPAILARLGAGVADIDDAIRDYEFKSKRPVVFVDDDDEIPNGEV
jgi:hypothetical protein